MKKSEKEGGWERKREEISLKLTAMILNHLKPSKLRPTKNGCGGGGTLHWVQPTIPRKRDGEGGELRGWLEPPTN